MVPGLSASDTELYFSSSLYACAPTPGLCGRLVEHGELGLRGPPESGWGEFSLLRLWQQPADGADPPRNPSAVFYTVARLQVSALLLAPEGVLYSL